MVTERQRQILIDLCDPIVRIGWCSFDRRDRGRNIVAGKLHKLGLVDRKKLNRGWGYRINDAGLYELQWEIDTAADIKRIAGIFESAAAEGQAP